MNGYRPARKRVVVSVGESVRMVRELQGLSQNDLAHRTVKQTDGRWLITAQRAGTQVTGR